MGWLSLVLSGGAINYLLRQISEMIVGLYISMKLGRVLHKHETWQGIIKCNLRSGATLDLTFGGLCVLINNKKVPVK